MSQAVPSTPSTPVRRRALLAWLLAGLVGLAPRPAAAATVAVNAAVTHQVIDGFGAATAWNTISSSQAPVLWADDSAAPVSNASAHVNGHAGFSILRVRIDPNANSSGTGVWNNEGNNMPLAVAQNSAIKIFGSEWTPPVADKENHALQSTGNSNSFLGLPSTANGTAGSAAADTDYSNYLVKYVNYIKSHYGISLYAISPQNEPDFNPGSYESALWTGPQFQVFVRDYLGPALQSAGLASTKIMITESFHDSLALAANTMNDAAAAPFVGLLAGHLYGAPTPPATLASANFSHLTTQHYWETEISDLSGTPFDTGMGTGLEEAAWIQNCMVGAEMNGFVHWWTNGTDKSALYNTSTGQWSDRFYVVGNYSKFVRPGFVRIDATANPASGVSVSAYDSPSRVVIVAINSNGSAVNQAFSLAGLNVSSMVPWLTDNSHGLVQQTAVAVSGGGFSYSLPAQSVVSFVGDLGGALTPSSTPLPSSTPPPTATPLPTATPVVASTWRVDAGGAAYTDTAGHLWTADAGFSGGTARTVTHTVAGTADQTLYQSERYGNSTYAFAVPAGSYQVTLKMAEIYDGHTAAGQRVFNASINGTTVISGLDLYAVAGGFAAVDRVFNNISPVNGLVTVQMGPASVDNATIGAIQIVPMGSLASPTASPTATPSSTATRTSTAAPSATSTVTATALPPTALPTATATPVQSDTWRVDAGGAAYTDTAGHLWAADEDFSGGTARTVTNTVAGTADQTLYQSERYGDSSYTFAVPAGSYQVTLKMAEIYDGHTAAGQRVFDASINGATVIGGLDLYAVAGPFTALDRVFSNVSPVNGVITIQMGPASADNATVGAIQIVPMASVASPTASPTATPSRTATASFTASPTLSPAPPSATATETATEAPPTATSTASPTPSPAPPTATATPTPTATASFTASPAATLTATPPPPPTATRTWTSTPVPPTATRTWTPTATRTWTATPAPTPAANVQVWHSSNDPAVGTGPHHTVQLRNLGSSPLDLSHFAMRYWLNCNCGSEGLQAWVDWAGFNPGGQALAASVVPQAYSGQGQTHVLLISFAGGSLPAGASAEVQFRFNRGNWAGMDQSDDYSYAVQPSLGPQAKVAAYMDGVLVWGTEPGGLSAAMAGHGDAVKGAPGPLALRVGPNPAHGRANVEIDLPQGGRVRLRVSDVAGESVLALDLGEHRAGSFTAPLDLNRLAPGLYLLRVDLSSDGADLGTAWFKLAVD